MQKHFGPMHAEDFLFPDPWSEGFDFLSVQLPNSSFAASRVEMAAPTGQQQQQQQQKKKQEQEQQQQQEQKKKEERESMPSAATTNNPALAASRNQRVVVSHTRILKRAVTTVTSTSAKGIAGDRSISGSSSSSSSRSSSSSVAIAPEHAQREVLNRSRGALRYWRTPRSGPVVCACESELWGRC